MLIFYKKAKERFKEIIKISALFSFTLLLGCTKQVYFNSWGQTFTSKGEALSHQKKVQNSILADITPTDKPIGGRALFVYPSRELLEEKGISVTSGTRKNLTKEQIEYTVEFMFEDVRYLADAIHRRKIFNEVDFHVSSTPGATSIRNYDFLIYMEFRMTGVGEWYFKRKESKSPKVWIWSIPAGLTGLSRILSICDSLQSTLQEDLD